VSARQSPEANPLVAALLRAGAYGAFALLLSGVLLDVAGADASALYVMQAGLLLLLATPAVRVLALAVVFMREGERKYAVIAWVVLAIVLASWAVGTFRV
jgi:uncharacterized membrane protein